MAVDVNKPVAAWIAPDAVMFVAPVSAPALKDAVPSVNLFAVPVPEMLKLDEA